MSTIDASVRLQYLQDWQEVLTEAEVREMWYLSELIRSRDTRMDNMILLPRSVVAALVDPAARLYLDGQALGYCVYCNADREIDAHDAQHEPTCPVRVIQERLKEREQ